MAIVPTAHFEIDMDDDDQAAAYRDEPSLSGRRLSCCARCGQPVGDDNCPDVCECQL